jgi:hypothetical protein
MEPITTCLVIQLQQEHLLSCKCTRKAYTRLEEFISSCQNFRPKFCIELLSWRFRDNFIAFSLYNQIVLKTDFTRLIRLWTMTQHHYCNSEIFIKCLHKIRLCLGLVFYSKSIRAFGLTSLRTKKRWWKLQFGDVYAKFFNLHFGTCFISTTTTSHSYPSFWSLGGLVTILQGSHRGESALEASIIQISHQVHQVFDLLSEACQSPPNCIFPSW